MGELLPGSEEWAEELREKHTKEGGHWEPDIVDGAAIARDAFAAGAAEERKKLHRALPEEAATVQAWCDLRMERDRALARVAQLETAAAATRWTYCAEDDARLQWHPPADKPVSMALVWPDGHTSREEGVWTGTGWTCSSIARVYAWAPLPETPEVRDA